ncbi:polysaccharide lyase family 1 protein [Nocardia sp. NPDC127579]|uniref:pectate lyase family protein n=1 Tax=Nocardia sp. NPDC127579 TaxID=3345402 RepID=UPI003636B1C9
MNRRMKGALALAFLPALLMTWVVRSGPVAAQSELGLGRERIAANDGWAAAEGGTTGGSAATADQVFTVDTKEELRRAVAGDTPKIVYVRGHIQFLAECASYNAPGYTEQAYLDAVRGTTLDPDHANSPAPIKAIEKLRKTSENNQSADITMEVGSNTTIVGLAGAQITGLELGLTGKRNVIIRNLSIQDAYGCFPRWSGYDWKTYFSNIRMEASSHVWLDHLTLGDGTRTLATETKQDGKTYLHHDELITAMKGSDLITVSWTRLHDNFKPVMLGVLNDGGSSVANTRVTMHHNLFDKTVLRSPSVYYGKVHLYNNSHVVPPSVCCWYYQWGVGTQSKIYAENNSFTGGMPKNRDILWNFAGQEAGGKDGAGVIHESGSMVAGQPVNLVAEFNGNRETGKDYVLGTNVGWAPTLHGTIDPTAQVPAIVAAGAGAGRAVGGSNPPATSLPPTSTTTRPTTTPPTATPPATTTKPSATTKPPITTTKPPTPTWSCPDWWPWC